MAKVGNADEPKLKPLPEAILVRLDRLAVDPVFSFFKPSTLFFFSLHRGEPP
jgi:hypothetical protein